MNQTLSNIKGLFGRVVQTHIFSFQTTLHTFPHTFLPTHISKNYKQHYSNYTIKRALNVQVWLKFEPNL